MKFLHSWKIRMVFQLLIYLEDTDSFIAYHDRPYAPTRFSVHDRLAEIPAGKAVILAPYAKSVVTLPREYWDSIIQYCSKKDYRIYANVVGEEKGLPGTR